MNEQLDEAQVLIHKFFENKEKFKNYLIASTLNGSSNSGDVNSSPTGSGLSKHESSGGKLGKLGKKLPNSSKHTKFAAKANSPYGKVKVEVATK